MGNMIIKSVDGVSQFNAFYKICAERNLLGLGGLCRRMTNSNYEKLASVKEEKFHSPFEWIILVTAIAILFASTIYAWYWIKNPYKKLLVPDESVADESVADENVADDNVADENVADENLGDENVADENVAAEPKANVINEDNVDEEAPLFEENVEDAWNEMVESIFDNIDLGENEEHLSRRQLYEMANTNFVSKIPRLQRTTSVQMRQEEMMPQFLNDKIIHQKRSKSCSH